MASPSVDPSISINSENQQRLVKLVLQKCITPRTLEKAICKEASCKVNMNLAKQFQGENEWEVFSIDSESWYNKNLFPGKARFLSAVLEQLDHYPGHP